MIRFSIDSESEFAMLVFFGAILVLVINAALFGSHRALGFSFLDDINSWKGQRIELKLWHKFYIAAFYLMVVYPLSLWHTVAIAYESTLKSFSFVQPWVIVPMPILWFDHTLLNAAVFFLWIVVTIPLVNIASKIFFPHSWKARRVAHAIVMQVNDPKLKPYAEELANRIQVNQVDHSWVTIWHDLPVTSMWFRQKKNEIAAAAQLRIVDQKEISEWIFAFKCEYYRPDVREKLSASDWVENVEWTYFISYFGKLEKDEASTKAGKVCKIGTSKDPEEYRLKTYRTSNPDAKIELKIPSSELNEDDAHALFAESEIDGEVFVWAGQVEQFVEQRKLHQSNKFNNENAIEH